MDKRLPDPSKTISKKIPIRYVKTGLQLYKEVKLGIDYLAEKKKVDRRDIVNELLLFAITEKHPNLIEEAKRFYEK